MLASCGCRSDRGSLEPTAPARRGLIRIGLRSAIFLLLSLATEQTSAQISGTWTGTGGLNGDWSITNNWVGGVKPTGGLSTTIYLGSTSGTTTIRQDLADAFVLNRLSVTNLQGAGLSSYTLTGGALRFEGNSAAISVQSVGTTTQTIYNQLIIGSTNGLTISAQSAGNSLYVIHGNITSSQTGSITLTLGGGTNKTSVLHGLIGDGSGTLSLVKTNAGSAYYLTNVNNTFSGNVTVAGGTLYVASLADVGQASALGRGAAVFLGGVNDGILTFSSGGNIGVSTNRSYFLNSTAAAVGTIANESNDPNATLTLSGGVITTSVTGLHSLVLSGANAGANAVYSVIHNGGGTVGLSKKGSGLWVVGGTNTFSGGTSIFAGALRVTNFAANLGGGNVKFLASASVVGVLEAAGTLTASLGTGAGQVFWNAGGGFAASTADLTLRLNNGTSALVWNSGSFVADGQELQLGSATSQGTVTLENSLNLADSQRAVRVSNGAADVDAVISGSLFSSTPASASLSKLGPGTLRLTADNTYAGTTTIVDGTLILGNNGAAGSLAGPVHTYSGGVLAFNRSDSFTFTSAVTGSGGVRVLSGSVNLNGANTFTGGITVAAGASLRVRGTAWPTVGDVTVAGGTLTFSDTVSRAVMQTFVTGDGAINVFNSATTLTRLDLGSGALNVLTANASVQTLTLGGGATVTVSTARSLIALTNSYAGAASLTNAPQIQFQADGSAGAMITGPGTLVLSGTHNWLQVDDTPTAPYDLTIEAAITKSGSTGLLKYGAGTLYFPNAQSGLKNSLFLLYNGIFAFGDDRALGDTEFRFTTNASRTDLVSATTATLRTDGIAAYTLTNNVTLANLLHYVPVIAGAGDLTLAGIVTNSDDGQTLLLSLDAGRTLTVHRLLLSNDAAAKTLTLGGTGFSVLKQIDGGTTATTASRLHFNGTGTYLLTGDNGYRGGTTISSGTVIVTGAISGTVHVGGVLQADGDVAGSVIVQNGGLVNGNGSIGSIAVQSGGTLSVGHSVGTLTLDGDGLGTSAASLQLDAGSTLVFEFNDATGSYGNSSGGWDYIELGVGLLTINAQNASDSDRINLRIDSLTLANVHGTAVNFNASPGNVVGYYWKFIGLNDLDQIQMFGGASLNDRFRILDAEPNAGVFYDDGVPNGNPFARPESWLGQGTFTVLAGNYGQGAGLYIRYSAIPEPSGLALAGIGSAAAWYGKRRRKQLTAATDSVEG